MSSPFNILLITADHLRSDAIACNRFAAGANALAHKIQTPHLDQLAASGATFTHCYSPNPICVPARASITTGNYSHRCTGYKSNQGGILPGQPTLGGVFSAAGYWTCAIGKLHYLPYAAPGAPRTLHGFQYAELNEEGRIIGAFDPSGTLRGLEDYHDWLSDQGWHGYERSHGIGNNDAKPSASTVPAEFHEESWVAQRTIAALDAHIAQAPGKPFLLWSSFTKPHPPYDPPHPYDTMYDPRDLPEPIDGWGSTLMADRDIDLFHRRFEFGWDSYSPQAVQTSRARYAGLVSFQDAQVGQILAHLEKTGLASNTIIVFTADHGDLLGDFGRFFKTCMYEGSVRVPLIWHVPGQFLCSHAPRPQLAGIQDIFPTLCALTGVSLPQSVDGQDLSPILAAAGEKGRDFIVSETKGGGQKAMLRSHRWKYIWNELGGREELYDLAADPQEYTDLSHDPACRDTLQDLRAQLIVWAMETRDEELLLDDGTLSSLPLPTIAPKFQASHLGWRCY